MMKTLYICFFYLFVFFHFYFSNLILMVKNLYNNNGRVSIYNYYIDNYGISHKYLEKITNYINNYKYGEEIIYFYNKKVKVISNFYYNKLDGTYLEFYENGLAYIECTYKWDVKTGYYKEWFENGILKIDCNYSMNLLNGKYKEYNKIGEIIKDYFYIYGVNQDIFYKQNYSTLLGLIYKNIYDKLIFYPFSEIVKSRIIYFANGEIKNKLNYDYSGKLNGIQIYKNINKYGNIFIQKRIRYKHGKIISSPIDYELIFKNKNDESMVSIANTELIGWKACLSNDEKTLNKPVIVKLKIPKNAKRLPFINDNSNIYKSRAEFAHVLDIYDYFDNEIISYKEAYSFISRNKLIYKKKSIVFPKFFDSDINNTRSGGIHYCLSYDDACKYHDNKYS